jgi:H(+)-transporting ATP synthase subunit D
MSAATKVAATRLELLRAKRRLERVSRGASLLRRRREALAHELLKLAKPAIDARAAVSRECGDAYRALLYALADGADTGVRALGWPSRDVRVEIRAVRVWGVPVADITTRSTIRRDPEGRAHSPAGTGPSVTDAATHFERLVELLLEAAPREMVLRRLGEALSRTSRQVHTLEQNVAPGLEAAIASVRDRLEQREREEHHRLKQFVRSRGNRPI